MISALMLAIKKGNLITRQGINQLAFDKLLDTTIATELGHLHQERKNLRLTKSSTNINTDYFPTKAITKTNDFFTQCFSMNINQDKSTPRRIYSDQTGRLPYVSSRGYQYIMIMYDYDSNAIMVEALKSRKGKELATVFYKLCTKLKINRNILNIFILDNKCSLSVKNNNGKYQLAPPHQNRQNATENAIKTFKSHFLSGLAT